MSTVGQMNAERLASEALFSILQARQKILNNSLFLPATKYVTTILGIRSPSSVAGRCRIRDTQLDAYMTSVLKYTAAALVRYNVIGSLPLANKIATETKTHV